MQPEEAFGWIIFVIIPLVFFMTVKPEKTKRFKDVKRIACFILMGIFALWVIGSLMALMRLFEIITFPRGFRDFIRLWGFVPWINTLWFSSVLFRFWFDIAVRFIFPLLNLLFSAGMIFFYAKIAKQFKQEKKLVSVNNIQSYSFNKKQNTMKENGMAKNLNFRTIGKFCYLLVIFGFSMPMAFFPRRYETLFVGVKNGFHYANAIIRHDGGHGILLYVFFIIALSGVIIGRLLTMKIKIPIFIDWVILILCIAGCIRFFMTPPDIMLLLGFYIVVIGLVVAIITQIISVIKKEV